MDLNLYFSSQFNRQVSYTVHKQPLGLIGADSLCTNVSHASHLKTGVQTQFKWKHFFGVSNLKCSITFSPTRAQENWSSAVVLRFHNQANCHSREYVSELLAPGEQEPALTNRGRCSAARCLNPWWFCLPNPQEPQSQCSTPCGIPSASQDTNLSFPRLYDSPSCSRAELWGETHGAHLGASAIVISPFWTLIIPNH